MAKKGITEKEFNLLLDEAYSKGYDYGYEVGKDYIPNNIGDPLYWDWSRVPDEDYYLQYVNQAIVDLLKTKRVRDDLEKLKVDILFSLPKYDTFPKAEYGYQYGKIVAEFYGGFGAGVETTFEEWWDERYDELVEWIETEDIRRKEQKDYERMVADVWHKSR